MGKLKLVKNKSIYWPSFKIPIGIINVLETKCGRLYSCLLPAFEFLTTAEVVNVVVKGPKMCFKYSSHLCHHSQFQLNQVNNSTLVGHTLSQEL